MKIKWLAGPMEVLGVGLMDTGSEYEVSDKIGSDLIAEEKAEAVSGRSKKPFKVEPDESSGADTQDGEEGDG